MKISKTSIPDLLVIEPDVYKDDRGFFMETWNQQKYTSLGLPWNFVQDNVSRSHKGVLRGLHYQYPNSQGKLVSVLEGEVFDVAVDLRIGSPTFGKWEGILLSEKNKQQSFVPPGFAHGFEILSDSALFSYKCTETYDAQSERTLLWSDPDIGIQWHTQEPLLSQKDVHGLRLKDIPTDRMMRYEAYIKLYRE
jgi:dTDP-4-dehydrorhamnose 3,5-epimerase